MQATTVAAKGSAEAPYTVATFSVSLSSKGTTVSLAKANVTKNINTLNDVLSDMKAEQGLEIVKNSLRTNSHVQEDWEYVERNREMVGYIVLYNLSFQIYDLDLVNKIYDTLTSLPEISVASPIFGLKPAQREKLSKKALKNAFEKAYERFSTECEVLGLNPSDFEIATWEVTYHDSQRSDRVAKAMSARAASNAVYESVSLAGGPMGAPGPTGATGSSGIDLVSGLAEVVVNLEVGYAKKGSTAVESNTARKPKELDNE